MNVSVIITAYNYARFLPDCLDSVLAQTALPDEIVILDDGSTDGTPEVVQPYLSNRCIKYIRTENSGVSAARNTAIGASSGEFVAILDADDKWRPDKLELQVPLFENGKVGVVYSLCQPFNEHGIVNDFARVPPQRGHILDALVQNNLVPLSSAIVRRECLERIGKFNESYAICADFELWTRLSAHGIEFDYVNEPLMMYRTCHVSMLSDVTGKHREKQAILNDLFDIAGPCACTNRVKRVAWATYFSKRAYTHYQRENQWSSLSDSIRSISHCPFGASSAMAWRILAKSIVPKRMVDTLKRYYGNG